MERGSRVGAHRRAKALTDALPSDRPFGLALVLSAAFAFWLGTQYVAYRLGYSRALGAWVYLASPESRAWWRAAAGALALASIWIIVVRRNGTWAPTASAIALFGGLTAFVTGIGPLYAPHKGIVWAVHFDRTAQHSADSRAAARAGSVRTVVLRSGPARAATTRTAQGTAQAAAIAQQGLFVSGAALVGLIGLVVLARPAPKRARPSTSHGSARWGDGEALLGNDGLMLGRISPAGGAVPSSRRAEQSRSLRTVFRYDGDGHLLTVAPTRSGKGVGCVIPNLLVYPGSVLVTDPKGENYAVTARARRMLGQMVHALDPFGIVGGTASFNPLDVIKPDSPDAIDDARLLADMLVVTDGKGAGGDFAHWNEEARALLAGLILYVAVRAPAELRTLSHVRELLTLAPESFRLLLQDMLECDDLDGLIARAAARHLQKADRERSGVVSAAQSHTHFLDSPRMARVLGASTFQFEDLKTTRTSVYLVLPPDRMDSYHRWLRIMVACGLRSTMRVPGMPATRVVFVLDEFAHLGRMQPVERDVGIAGGYGLTLWLLVQDLAQLKGIYPEKWQSFLANSDVFQAFGTNDWDTAEYLSKMTGETTIYVESENQSSGVSHGQHAQRQRGAAFTTSEKGRRLLTPDEILRLPGDEELIFVRGQAPIRATKLDYRVDRNLTSRADLNPMHARAKRLGTAIGMVS